VVITPPIRRFHKEESVTEGPAGFGIALDGRALKTPARGVFAVPARALAKAIADEWAAQAEFIRPETMPFTGLSNAALDRIAPDREGFALRLAAYGESDLLCYRAEGPAALTAAQAKAWQPWLDWLAARHGARLSIGEGIIHVAQPPEALEALRRVVLTVDPFRLAALHVLTAASGSLTLGLAVLDGALSADAAFGASRIDEEHQASLWGRDAEADARAARLRAEILAAERFVRLLGFAGAPLSP
jgi:chaperone required for assembly of F1-ATPase